MDGVKARLRAALASVEVPDSGRQRATNLSTDFPLQYYLRGGHVEVEAIGETFWKHADFEDSPVLRMGSVDHSWTDRLKLRRVDEDTLKKEWYKNVEIPVWTYLELLGLPLDSVSNCRIDRLPEWKDKVDARTDLG